MGLLSLLGAISPNANGTPNALQRMSFALHPEDKQQFQLQQLLSRMGPVPASGMGPQQPIDPQQFLTQLAGITGDAGALASYITAQEKRKEDEVRQKQIASILSGTPLQNFATGGSASGSNPLNVRNNNAGNLKDVTTGDFRKFDTPQEGLAAMAQDLNLKISGQSPSMLAKFGKGYTPTLTNVISTWAPSEENNTQAYIDAVSKKTGIPSDQPLTPADIEKIQPAMIEQEGGSAAAEYFGGKKQAQPEALQQLAQLAQIDPEKYAGEYLTAKAAYEKDQKKQEDSIITPDNENLTGEEFKATIKSKDVLNKANAMLRGDMPPPTINSRTPTVMKQALEAAQQIDPSYSATTYPVRKKVKEAFAAGPEAKNVNAINTVINHLVEWDKAVDDLHNWGGQPLNWAATNTSRLFSDKTNAKVKAANVAADAVGTEAAKAYRGVGSLSQEEIEGWKESLSPNLGPEARKQVAKQIGTLLLGKIDALNEQWATAFPNEPKNFLSPKAAKALKELGVEVDATDSGTPEGVDPAVWDNMTPEEKARFK